MENCTKEIKVATDTITKELRALEVGDKIGFPLPDYNYNSVRNSMYTALMNERIAGWRFRTKMDVKGKRLIVTREA